MLRKSFRKYLKDKIIPHYPEWEDAGIIPREVWLEAGKNGWLCPTAEEQFGGPGGDFLYAVIITEEIYYHGLCGLFWWVHSDIFYPYLEKYATDEQKQKWIPGCISGETILALAMTEPQVGSDIARLETTARREGDDYIVNGSKTFISNGQLADVCIVAVRSGEERRPHDGISLLLVETNTQGYQKGTNLEKIGLHAQDTSEIFFNDCRVPRENLLGLEGQGFKHLMENLQQERLLLAIGACAAARGAFDLTLNYVKQREAFGQTIGAFQNTRFAMAEMMTQIQLARSFLDDLIPRHMAGEDIVSEVSMAKYWITDLQFEVAHRCLQFFGGYGYMKEYPMEKLMRDAKILQIYEGTNQVQRVVISGHVLA